MYERFGIETRIALKNGRNCKTKAVLFQKESCTFAMDKEPFSCVRKPFPIPLAIGNSKQIE